jgi:chromosome segregation ATPase
MELTSTHKLLLEEAEGLRSTINEQNERVLELEDLMRLNAAPGTPNDDSDGSVLNSAASIEWDRQIIDLVSRYTGSFTDKESLLKKAENRSSARETLRLRVNDAFENQSSKITKLHDHVKESETKATEFEKNLKEIRSANQTLKLENRILKTAGKERDQRSTKMQAKLKEENESLKQSISKLTQQTADHQLKIRRLAIKQASLQRKKESARNHDKTKAAKNVKVTATTSASEDMGSLAFSADSQDATDSSAHPSRASSPAARRGSASLDRSVEVVLVDESLESRDDHTPS